MLLSFVEISEILGCEIICKNYSLDMDSVFATISTLLANGSTEPHI